MKQLFAVILLSLLYCLNAQAQDLDVQYNCEDTCKHVHGIDVSHYQGEIFWETVGENSKMAYVYMKATEGSNFLDDKYHQNLAMAKKHGLLVGSYHFFRPKVPVREQFDNFVLHCNKDEQDLIPMIDVEVAGKIQPEALRDSLSSFLQLVTEHYGTEPLVYTGRNFYDKYFYGGFLNDYKLMIAFYSDTEPELHDGRTPTMWQYTAKGTIKGIRGYVDESRFIGTHGMRELKLKKPAPEPPKKRHMITLIMEDED